MNPELRKQIEAALKRPWDPTFVTGNSANAVVSRPGAIYLFNSFDGQYQTTGGSGSATTAMCVEDVYDVTSGALVKATPLFFSQFDNEVMVPVATVIYWTKPGHVAKIAYGLQSRHQYPDFKWFPH